MCNTRVDISTTKLIRAFKRAAYPRKKTISNSGFLVSIETCSSLFARHSPKYSSHYQFESMKIDKHIFIRNTKEYTFHTYKYSHLLFLRVSASLAPSSGTYTKFKTYKNVMNYKVICIILQHSCN